MRIVGLKRVLHQTLPGTVIGNSGRVGTFFLKRTFSLRRPCSSLFESQTHLRCLEISLSMIADAERSGRANDPNSQTQAALENKHNMEQREQYYATVRKPGQQSPCREVSALERIPEYSEDIYPYATFNLQIGRAHV